MNSKLTKMFFVALTTSLTINAFAQTEQDRKKILADTNVDFLMKFSKEKEEFTRNNLILAQEKAREKGMPLSGVDKDGSYFQLVGYDQENDFLKYYSTFNNVTNGSSLTTSRAHALHAAGITGQDMIAGIWDGGIPRPNHFSLIGRVVVKDNGMTVTNPESEGLSHGIHVGGTIAANDYIPQAKGFAPSAKLWANNWTSDISEMSAQAAQGLLVSNHSYGLKGTDVANGLGVGFFGRYGDDARDYDLIANNAPYYSIVFAAGNDNNINSLITPNPAKKGKDLLTQAGVSKNTIVVAAIEGIQNYSASNVKTAVFSNYGPTDDFRIKPDISAKGVDVFSLNYTSTAATALNSGTSMAAPAVTGVITLWQQYYKQLFGVFMRSSTVKAVMVHTALEAGPVGPDPKFGWGIINAEAGAQILSEASQERAIVKEITLNQGEVYEYDYNYDGSNPLVATIAWNDPAGTAINTGTDISVKKLVNDLDLRVINVATGQESLPWTLKPTFSGEITAPSFADKVDNAVDPVERVNVQGNAAGVYKIRVSHKGTLQGGSQIFSLVVSASSGTLSTKEEELGQMELYPNPTSEKLNIVADYGVIANANVRIFDINGRLIYNNSTLFVNNGKGAIDVSSFSSGVYVLKVEKSGKTNTYKFIKK